MLNGEINEQLAVAADVGEGDFVLEIGPGTGSLTSVLINAGAYVLGIEKDPHMAALVSERFADTGRFKVLNEDFLKCHVRSHVQSVLEARNSLDANSRLAKVVANIPFNISTDIIEQLLPMGDLFSEVVLLLQEETALRLVESSAGIHDYRSINIFINFYSDPELKLRVPRTDFFPQPNVDAAVVKFRLKKVEDYPSVASTKSFFSLTSSAFNGKRKMLRRSLQHIRPPTEIENALGKIGLPTTSRPGELTMDDFVKLHNVLMEI